MRSTSRGRAARLAPPALLATVAITASTLVTGVGPALGARVPWERGTASEPLLRAEGSPVPTVADRRGDDLDVFAPVASAAPASSDQAAASGGDAAVDGQPDTAEAPPTPAVSSEATAEPTPTQAPATSQPRDARPNFVLITTDDQAMSDLAWMRRTRRLIAGRGVSFPKSINPHPLCCPARAEILTGQYAQNNGVRSNRGRYGGYRALDKRHTLATWLDAAGYQTAFVGKHLNGYGEAYSDPDAVYPADPGWTVFNPTTKGTYRYYNYMVRENDGHVRDYTGVHQSDMVAAKTRGYVKRFSASRKPFFIWASHVAPHGACVPRDELTCWQNPVPARRHRGMFAEVDSPSLKNPAFNEKDVSDKPRHIRRLEPRSIDRINSAHRARIESLQAVDESVAATVRALRRAGELGNTYLLFTSDNGFLLGEHRKIGKNSPYRQALSVPLLLRGPGIKAGVRRPQKVLTIDIAPTILDAANARADLPVDGRSLLPLARRARRAGTQTALIQAGPDTAAEVRRGWSYRGVHTGRYTYARWFVTGEEELYDRRADPHELTNVANRRRYRPVLRELRRRTAVLDSCSGAQCRQRFGAVPNPLPRK